MPFSTSMDTKGKKKIYAFAKGTKTGIFHSWEKVKGLVNGKPDKIYKLLQSNEGIEFLQQHGIDPEETEEGELSQGVGYLETKKNYF